MTDTFSAVFSTATFWSALLGWLIAQLIKMLLNLIKTRRIDFAYLVSTGGMPSAHSATVAGLAASIGINSGFTSDVFVLSMSFALITMFDASTVRRAAGQQASILNMMVDELFKDHHISEKKLKELLGHTRLEVFMGMTVGILVAMLVNGLLRAQFGLT